MKPPFKFLLAAVFLAGTVSSFAKPNPAALKVNITDTIDRHLSGFNSIKIAGHFNVYITQGAVESVKLEAPGEITDRIITEVNGDVLKIHNKHDNWGWGEKSWYSEKSWWRKHQKKIDIYITAKDLNSISISGSGDVSFKEGIVANSLKLKVRGSGEITGKIEVKKLESKISGSGIMKLSGNAESSKVKVAGSGNFAARELITVNSAVHLSGSGHAAINARDKVDATIHGSAGVSYTGTAKIINSTKSGSGEISRF
jgi:Putative auto-transporter adhesin, head GIN domain